MSSSNLVILSWKRVWLVQLPSPFQLKASVTFLDHWSGKSVGNTLFQGKSYHQMSQMSWIQLADIWTTSSFQNLTSAWPAWLISIAPTGKWITYFKTSEFFEFFEKMDRRLCSAKTSPSKSQPLFVSWATHSRSIGPKGLLQVELWWTSATLTATVMSVKPGWWSFQLRLCFCFMMTFREPPSSITSILPADFAFGTDQMWRNLEVFSHKKVAN